MELVELENTLAETTALRLVSDNREPQSLPKLEKQFVNFIFFRVSPEWRKLDAETKTRLKEEFAGVFAEYGSRLLLFNYSLVGFDSKADLMFWRIGNSLDVIQDMTAKMFRTGLGSFLQTTDSYLSITKKVIFVSPVENANVEDRFHTVAGEKKYLFVYPCAKNREWYEKTGEEREKLIE